MVLIGQFSYGASLTVPHLVCAVVLAYAFTAGQAITWGLRAIKERGEQ